MRTIFVGDADHTNLTNFNTNFEINMRQMVHESEYVKYEKLLCIQFFRHNRNAETDKKGMCA